MKKVFYKIIASKTTWNVISGIVAVGTLLSIVMLLAFHTENFK